MANGAIYNEEKEVFHIHDRKLDALEACAGDTGAGRRKCDNLECGLEHIETQGLPDGHLPRIQERRHQNVDFH